MDPLLALFPVVATAPAAMTKLAAAVHLAAAAYAAEVGNLSDPRQVNAWVNHHHYAMHAERAPILLDAPRKTGNCVDFAATKYALLVAGGVDPKDLRLVLLQRQGQHYLHVTLVMHTWGTYVVLDIGTDAPQLAANYAHPGDRYYGAYLGPHSPPA